MAADPCTYTSSSSIITLVEDQEKRWLVKCNNLETRAKNAERKYLELKIKTCIESYEDKIRKYEQEFQKKMKLYASSGKQDGITKFYQKKISDLSTKTQQVKELHEVCLEYHEQGLSLADLPDLEEDLELPMEILKLDLDEKVINLKKENEYFENFLKSRFAPDVVPRSGTNFSEKTLSSEQLHHVTQPTTYPYPIPEPILTSIWPQHVGPNCATQSSVSETRSRSPQRIPSVVSISHKPVEDIHPNQVNSIDQKAARRLDLAEQLPFLPLSSLHIDTSRVTQSSLESSRTQMPMSVSSLPNISGDFVENDQSNAPATVLSAFSHRITGETSEADNPFDDSSEYNSSDDDRNVTIEAVSQPDDKIERGKECSSANVVSSAKDVNKRMTERKASVSDDEEFTKQMVSLKSDWKTVCGGEFPKDAKSHRPASKKLSKSPNNSPRSRLKWDEGIYIHILQQLAKSKRASIADAKAALDSATEKLGSAADLEKLYQTACDSLKKSSAAFDNYKTKLCHDWENSKSCPKGPFCTFAHGNKDLRSINQTPSPGSFYKVLPCRNYMSNGGCPWGEFCLFAHGDHELRNLSSHTTQKELEKHLEPCNSQYCPEKLKYLVRKTQLCVKNNVGQCPRGKEECSYAHSTKEKLPMPKWEYCERFKLGNCPHQHDSKKCVYAHSPDELRPVPVSVRNMRAKDAKKAKAQLKTSQTGAWGTNNTYQSQHTESDECVICMMSLLKVKRGRLDCGHDQFHMHCIQQWVNEGLPHCPVCRKSASLPDFFKPPIGMKSGDFPKL